MTGGKAYLNDPARGSYSVSMAAFDESFTGMCMMFEPTEDFVPSGRQKSMLSFAKKRLNITRVAMRDSARLYAATVAGIEMIETIKATGALVERQRPDADE